VKNSHRVGRSRKGRFGAIVLATIAVAGCMVGPDYKDPGALVADQWLESNSPGIVTDRRDDRDWWANFNDPVLNQLIDVAYRQNLSLLQAGAQVLQARAELGVAVGNFYPQQQGATGDLSYNRQSQFSPGSTSSSSSLATFTQTTLGVGLSWEVDFWGKFRRAIQAADALFLSSVAAYDNLLVTLTADVAGTYVSIRTLEARLGIARENVRIQRESLEIARARFEGGATSERDVAQAETVLASTEATIPQIEQQLQQQKNALSILLGMPPTSLDSLLGAGKGIPQAPKEAAIGIPADLLRRRPDIRQAELQAIAQNARIGFEKAALYPSLSLTGNFGYLGSDWNRFDITDMFMSKARQWQVGPAVQWNILNYGQITNQVRSQDAAFQAAIFAYQNTVLQAQREVEDGLAQFLQSQVRTTLQSRAADYAKRSLDLSVLQYREGIVDFTTVLTAQQDLLNAQDQLVQASGDIPQGLIFTYRALGGGWQLREGRDFLPPDVQETMANRTDWGNVLTPVNLLQPNAPGLPGADNVSPRVRPPEW
jgi:efflux transporter, outer membrane factor (OMF) lipoprotein, NodT family